MPDFHNGIAPTHRPDKYFWLKNKLELDLMDITEEVIKMPVLMQDAGEFTAMAIEIRESAKEDLERTIAQVAENLRNTTTPSGKQRSETAIASAIPLSPLVEQKQKELSEARLDAALWTSLVNSLRDKSTKIHVIADQINSGFITPSSIQEKRRKEIRNVEVNS